MNHSISTFSIKNKLLLSSVLFCFVILLDSCGIMILRLAGHLKQPKLETRESIIKYSADKNDPYDILWLASSKENFDTIFRKYDGVPIVLIYDKHFSLLENAHGEGCQKRLIEFFNDSSKYTYIKVRDSSYQFLKNRTLVADSKEMLPEYDYAVVYCWAKYFPKGTEDLFERLAAIKRKGTHKICFISLNKDYLRVMHRKAPKFRGIKNTGRADAPKGQEAKHFSSN